MQAQSQFRFKNTDSIGAAGAEEDHEFLSECFVDNGEIGILEDQKDVRQIIVGRTGTGKTALIFSIKKKHPNTTIEINPENLALTYVSNSTIIKYLSSIGVNLDPFFKLLWRHVLVVEVLQKYFSDKPEKRDQNLFLVFRLTREAGFQEEKYESLYLRLTWPKNKLIDILDRRIGLMVKRRYTSQPVTHKDLLPKEFNNKPISQFIWEIANRPRDVIDFFNKCILAGADKIKLSSGDVKLGGMCQGEMGQQLF